MYENTSLGVNVIPHNNKKSLAPFWFPSIIYAPSQQGFVPHPNFELELAQLVKIMSDLVEIVMNLGRIPLDSFPFGDWIISYDLVTFHNLEYAISMVNLTYVPFTSNISLNTLPCTFHIPSLMYFQTKKG